MPSTDPTPPPNSPSWNLDQGHPSERCRAIVCKQRSDSSLRLNLHWHALVLDGVYTGFAPREDLTFHHAEPLRDEEVEDLVRHIHALAVGELRRRGHLDDEGALAEDAGEETLR